MKNYFSKLTITGLLYIGIFNSICLGQEKYVVTANQGLNLRATASLSGLIIKKNDYGTLLWVSEVKNGWAEIVDTTKDDITNGKKTIIEPIGYSHIAYLKKYNSIKKKPPLLVFGDTLQHNYILNVSNINAYNVGYGVGIDMRNPDNPVAAQGGIAFLKDKLPVTPNILFKENDSEHIKNTRWRYSTKFLDDDESEEFKHELHANFQASYKSVGISVSGGANADIDAKKIETHHNILYIYEAVYSPDISNFAYVFSGTPKCEHITSDFRALDNFLFHYGSHYIYKIDYGYKIIIKVSMKESESIKSNTFSAHIKAKFKCFGGKVDGESVTAYLTNDNIKDEDIEIQAVIKSGGISPDRTYSFNSFAGINDFIEKLNNGDIAIYSGPIRIYLQSYYPHLNNFARTQKLFSSGEQQQLW